MKSFGCVDAVPRSSIWLPVFSGRWPSLGCCSTHQRVSQVPKRSLGFSLYPRRLYSLGPYQNQGLSHVPRDKRKVNARGRYPGGDSQIAREGCSPFGYKPLPLAGFGLRGDKGGCAAVRICMSYGYSEKLKDPRWQKCRLRILERDGWKCSCCLETTETLHVHHLVYSKGDPWDAPEHTLETLCETCHEWREGFNKVWGRCLISTSCCQYFEGFFEDAFSGKMELGRFYLGMSEMVARITGRFRLIDYQRLVYSREQFPYLMRGDGDGI